MAQLNLRDVGDERTANVEYEVWWCVGLRGHGVEPTVRGLTCCWRTGGAAFLYTAVIVDSFSETGVNYTDARRAMGGLRDHLYTHVQPIRRTSGNTIRLHSCPGSYSPAAEMLHKITLARGWRAVGTAATGSTPPAETPSACSRQPVRHTATASSPAA